MFNHCTWIDINWKVIQSTIETYSCFSLSLSLLTAFDCWTPMVQAVHPFYSTEKGSEKQIQNDWNEFESNQHNRATATSWTSIQWWTSVKSQLMLMTETNNPYSNYLVSYFPIFWCSTVITIIYIYFSMKYSNVFSVRRHRDKHRKRKNIKTTSDKIYVSSFYPLIKHLFVIAQLNKYLFHLQFYTLFILRNYIANLVMSTISSWRIWSFACLVHSKFVVLVNISLG